MIHTNERAVRGGMLRARTSVLVHVLPDDVVQLVAMHAACTAIQRAYRRHAVPRLHFGHVHHKRWDTVRERWRRLDVLTPLYPYPIVRREWRHELGSWDALGSPALRGLCEEARSSGLWGAPAPGIARIASRHARRSP